ncbi:MAG: von Willebrand factor type A domain-containing protein, partial [Rhodanobacteraceae bacterium]
MNAKALLRCILIAIVVAVAGCTTSPNPTNPPGQQPPAEPHATVKSESPAKPPQVSPTPIPAPGPLAQRNLAATPTPPAADAIRSRELKASNEAFAQGFVMSVPPQPLPGTINRENYTHYDDNPVHAVAEAPVSTFSIDVDTGSYTNVRRMLEEGRLPPADAVRAEEFINYFDYAYAPPAERRTPFSVTTELAPAPWNAERQLLLVGIQGYRVPVAQIPAVNLVFLVDTSGSMNEPSKLPLLKASLKQLVPKLRANDRIAIVTYAGSAGLALASTPGDQHARIAAAIDAMQPAGSTNGQAGIELA